MQKDIVHIPRREWDAIINELDELRAAFRNRAWDDPGVWRDMMTLERAERWSKDDDI